MSMQVPEYNYDSESVKQAVILLNQGNKEADKYLTLLYVDNKSWDIAYELIQNPQSQNQQYSQIQLEQIQFQGCQTLLQKCRKDFSKLDASKIQNLKQFIFEKICNTNAPLSKPSYVQLCSCIGVIGLIGIGSVWESLFSDIVAFMQKSEQQLYFGVEILLGFADNLNKLIINEEQKMNITRKINSQSDLVFSIFSSLVQKTTRLDLLIKVLVCIQEWSASQIKFQIQENPQLIQNICEIAVEFKQNEEILDNVNQIFKNIFSNSDINNILIAREIDPSVQYTQNQRQSHTIIIQFLRTYRQQFQQSLHDNNYLFFSKVYASILSEFLFNNNTYLLEDQQLAIELLSMVMETMDHKVLKVSEPIIDFLCSARAAFKQMFPLQQYFYLVEAYREIMKKIIFKARYSSPEIKQKEENDELDIDDTKLMDYRKMAADLLLNCIAALTSQDNQQGITYFQDIIIQLLSTDRNSQEYMLNIEVGLFTITQCIDDSNYFFQQSDFLVKIIQFIVEPNFPNSYFTVSAALQFFCEVGYQIKVNNSLLDPVIKFIIQNIKIQENSNLACIAFSDIVNFIDEHSCIDVFTFSVDNFVNILQVLQDQTAIENLIQAEFQLGLKLQVAQYKRQAFQKLFQIIIQKNQQFVEKCQNNNFTEQDFEVTLNIISSIFKGFDVYDVKSVLIIQEEICTFANNSIQFINALYSKYGSQYQKKFTDIYQRIIQRTAGNLNPSFVNFLNQSVEYVQQNPVKNYLSLKIITQLLTSLNGKDNEIFDQWLSQYFGQLNTAILQLIQNTQDVDLIQNWIEMLRKTGEYNCELLLGLQDIQLLMQHVVTVLNEVINYQLQREIMIFFMAFLLYPKIQETELYNVYMPVIMKGIWRGIALIPATFMHHFTQILVPVCKRYRSNIQVIQQLIFESLQQRSIQDYLAQEEPESQNYQLFPELIQKTSEIVCYLEAKHLRIFLGEFNRLMNKYTTVKDTYALLLQKYDEQIKSKSKKQQPIILD